MKFTLIAVPRLKYFIVLGAWVMPAPPCVCIQHGTFTREETELLRIHKYIPLWYRWGDHQYILAYKRPNSQMQKECSITDFRRF